MAKRPSLQFYPGDWMKDPALRSVEVGARGLWMDLLCLMHECPARGVLAHYDGRPWSIAEISRATGVPHKVAKKYVDCLIMAGVCEFDSNRTISSRRLVRDEQERKKNQERQKRFRDSGDLAENVTAISGEYNAQCNAPVTRVSQRSSSSSSTSEDPSTNKDTSKVSKSSAAKAPPSPVWKGCEFFRMTESEFIQVENWYRQQGLSPEILALAIHSVDNWLSDETPKATAARKSSNHHRRLYKTWCIESAVKLLQQKKFTSTGKPLQNSSARERARMRSDEAIRQALGETENDEQRRSSDASLVPTILANVRSTTEGR